MSKKQFLYSLSGAIILPLIMLSFGFIKVVNDCEVLLDRINESYVGECKKNLAHGIGVAKGKDTYEGEFKKGYPDGYGIYTFDNKNKYEGIWSKGLMNGKGKMYFANVGRRDSVVTGYWKQGRYVGQYNKLHKVGFKQNIRNVKFRYINDKQSKIEVRVIRNGNPISGATNFNLASSTDAVIRIEQNLGMFDNATFPFSGIVDFSVPGGLDASTIVDGRVEFEIFKPGYWVVTIESN